MSRGKAQKRKVLEMTITLKAFGSNCDARKSLCPYTIGKHMFNLCINKNSYGDWVLNVIDAENGNGIHFKSFGTIEEAIADAVSYAEKILGCLIAE